MPQIQPDAAPVKKAPAPRTQQQPTQPAPVQQVVTQQPATTARPTATTASPARVHKSTARKPDRAKARRAKKPDPARHASRPQASAPPPRVAAIAARRVAQVLAFDAPSVSTRSKDDGVLFAGAALLLLVVAAGSLLRLSARMSGDLFGGRPG